MQSKKLLMSFVVAGALCTALPAAAKPDNAEQKVDKEMNRIVRALERNKKSAQILIQAARNAGADPRAVAEMEQMSTAFREAFMATVSPQQLVESILGVPEIPDSSQGLIITGPDGSTWLVMPSDQKPQVAPGTGCPALDKKPARRPKSPQPGMQVPPPPPAGQNMPKFAPPQPRMQVPPPPPGTQRGMQVPTLPPAGQNMPKFAPPQPGMQVPPPGNAPQGTPAIEGELIILEEGPQYMPLWPSKDDLGKDGVLKYLEKREARIRGY